MKITFVMVNPNMTGGDRVCAIYAKKLMDLGHIVNIVAPKKRYLSTKHQVKRVLKGKPWLSKKEQSRNHFDLLGLELLFSESFSPLMAQSVPDADVVIATWWKTAEWVNSFSDKKGKKVYFIQGYEVYEHLPKERVKATYRYPFFKITIAKWLVSIMQNDYFADKVALVPNSVNHELFYADRRGKQTRPTIGFLFSESEFKGIKTTLKVIDNLKQKISNLRVIAFGSYVPAIFDVPDYIELTINPKQEEIRLLYQQCDLWLCCSLIEGFGLTILEAMACRVPAVSTKCGGPESIITEGKNGYLCDVNAIEALTVSSMKVLHFSEYEWLKFSDNAYDHAQSYSWSEAVRLFESALQEAANS